MAFESKALIIAIFNYIKDLDENSSVKKRALQYLQQLANADSVVLELPEDKKAGE
ncbi:MAG: hypothetical protein LBK41_02875 [Clostridiales bacterium]|jgi:hypothetical protein|nr:hypothetical protein [Clostridiales bacterium]